MKNTLKYPGMLFLVTLLTACAPEPGSEAWCEDMAGKPKGDWTANEASEFASSCILKTYNND